MAKAEGEVVCSACQVEESKVWRRTREEPKGIICNKCYCKKYKPTPPRPPPGMASFDEADDKAQKRKKSTDELAAADSLAAKVKEEKKVKHEPDDEPAEKKSKKAKKDKKADKEDKAGVKDRIKDELNHEVKGESQVDAKFNIEDMVDDDDVVYPISDTEPSEVDITKYPALLHVEGSTSSRVDGDYRRLSKACCGHPCYRRYSHQEKITYLYFKKKKWMFGLGLGIGSHLACVKGVEGVFPVEPYPELWKVIDKAEKRRKEQESKDQENKAEEDDEKKGAKDKKDKTPYITVLSCRVVDGRVMDTMCKPGAQAAPAQARQASERPNKQQTEQLDAIPDSETVESRPKEHADSAASDAKEAAAADIQATKATPDAGGNSESSAAKADTKGYDRNSAEEDEEEKQVASSSDDEQSGNDSDSSSSDSEKKGKASPTKAAGDPAAAKAKVESSSSAASLEARLYGELSKITEQEAREKKLKQFKIVIMKQLDGGAGASASLAGIPPEQLQALILKLERDFFVRAAVPKAPSGPPPRHLLPKHLQEQHESLPSHAKPPEGDPRCPSHRAAIATKSCLKQSGARRNYQRRIDKTMMQQHSRIDEIASYRGQGDLLWFTMPGAVVICDGCGGGVPQALGMLQGDNNRSQFAQSLFVCNDCLNRQHADFGFDHGGYR